MLLKIVKAILVGISETTAQLTKDSGWLVKLANFFHFTLPTWLILHTHFVQMRINLMQKHRNTVLFCGYFVFTSFRNDTNAIITLFWEYMSKNKNNKNNKRLYLFDLCTSKNGIALILIKYLLFIDAHCIRRMQFAAYGYVLLSILSVYLLVVYVQNST